MLRYPMSLKVIHYTEELIFQKVSNLDLAFFEPPTFFNQMTHAHKQATLQILNFLNNLAVMLLNIVVLISLL